MCAGMILHLYSISLITTFAKHVTTLLLAGTLYLYNFYLTDSLIVLYRP